MDARVPLTETHPMHPARVTPLDHPPSRIELLRLILRNPIEAWPTVLYKWPILRQKGFGPERVFVMDPDLVQQVLVTEADAFDKAESMRRALVPALGEAILTADGERWRWQRRAAAPIFRHERILAFLPDMVAAAQRTRDRWLALPAGSELDLGHEMMRSTYEIIVATMLSGEGSMDVAQVERSMTDYLSTTTWPIALGLLQAPKWLPYPGRRRAMRARDYLRGEVLRLVAERRAAGSTGGDLPALLLRATDPETGRSMDDRDIADNLLTFIAAGHETTALALTWTLYLLNQHPEIEARVLAEIATVCGRSTPTPEQIDRLRYTRQVLMEAMRLYPPAAVVTRMATREVTIGDTKLAPKTSVFVPTYAIHRHETLWDEPDRFDPERFTEAAVKARHRYAYLPFGAGPRICIGSSFALIEATAILAILLPAIRLRLRAGFTPTLQMRITLRPGTGMWMNATPRPLSDRPLSGSTG